MKRKLIYFFLLLIIIFTFVILYKSVFKSNLYIPSNNINKKIQEFSGEDLFSNNTINIKDIVSKKKYTIINIWSSWCNPCRAEHKYLMALKELPNINLIGLNYKDNPINAKKFVYEFDNPFLNILKDPNGLISIELGAYGVPETFIINKEYTIIKKFIGELTEKNFNEIIKITKK